MDLFATLHKTEHEQVVFCHNKDAGLKAIIAIHDTTLGPALGGLRMWPYKTEQEALNDVLRLSRGMTYKAAVSGLNLGGGKSVIIGDPRKDKSEALFRAFGQFIDSLNGRYITSEDVGISVEDIELVYQETDNVVGIPQIRGGSGDPSPFTAFGTLQGIKASLQKKYGNQEIGKYTYAVQGCGHVGFELVKLLRAENAKVFVTDINQDLVDQSVAAGCEAVGVDDIYDVDADVFSPTALGAIINEETLPRFNFNIICGAANNQLATDAIANDVEARGILYAPDYAVNAGGVMNVSIELEGYNRDRAMRMTSTIYDNIGKIFDIADRDGITTAQAADRLAEERIASVGKLKLPFKKDNAHRFPSRGQATQ